jgi:DNA invertase Pin-like site-specific DNA recombinase
MIKKKIDESVKQKVIEARASGLSLRKIADQFGISPTSVGRIVKEKGHGETTKKKTDRQRRIETLETKIAELEKKIFEVEAKHLL